MFFLCVDNIVFLGTIYCVCSYVYRGDRSGVDNIVFLLTDGGSNVNPSTTIQRARDLKNNGADIYVIAIGDQVNCP